MVNDQAKALVVVTRPQPQCDEWVEALRKAGWDALPFPLLTIGPSPGPQFVQQTVHELLTESGTEERVPLRAVMAVSGAAFLGFVDALGSDLWARLRACVDNGLRFWVTGPGSAKVLNSKGVPMSAIDYPGGTTSSHYSPDGTPALLDSQTVWRMVQSQVDPSKGAHKVLMVRGSDEQGQYSGNPWMGIQLKEHGVLVTSVLAYQRLPPAVSPNRQAIWEKASNGKSPCIWVFSSSQGLPHLPSHDWEGARAVATHPRLATKVRELGFSEVKVAGPGLESVIASLKSFHD